MIIPLSRPNLDKKEITSVTKTIYSGWITQGPKVEEFEENFSNYTGSKYAAAVSSCTTGLHLSLLAVGVQPGDLVITVSHSYIATANAIRHAFGEPVFVDVNRDNYNMDYESLKNFIENKCISRNGNLYFKDYKKLIKDSPTLKYLKNVNGKIKSIIVPHQIGIPADVYKIKRLVKNYNISIIEDAACAIGSKYNFNNQLFNIGRPIGDLTCFSFHPRKLLTTGDGGMVTSNNKSLINKVKLLRNHGMNKDSFKRRKTSSYFFDEHIESGFNYRLTDLQASIGIEQLKKIDKMVKERRKIANEYIEKLSNIQNISTFKESKKIIVNWQSFPVNILSKESSKQIVNFLYRNGIYSKRGVMNSHEEPPYIKQRWTLPNSEHILEKTFLLPMYSGLKDKEIEYVFSKVKEFFEK